jgi:WD40 repeat protein
VRIWDLATGQERGRLAGHHAYVLAASPDGRWLASAGDNTVRIWDLATGQERARLAGRHALGHVGYAVVWALAVAPDGSWLASGSGDGTVRIWDMASGRQRARLTGHIGRVRAVAVAPDGSWLASTGNDQTVRIWRSATGESTTLIRIGDRANTCTWTSDGAAVAVGGAGGLYLFSFTK